MPEIIPIAPEHIMGFRDALGSIACERSYLARIDFPSVEWANEFVANNIAKGHVQFVAIGNGTVVGFCDIIPSNRPGFQHCGSVGMGVIKAWRHHGLGKALLSVCIQKAIESGLTRIELEVYADNSAAIALYRSLGFLEEGLQRKARFLDGQHQDLLLMAILCEPFEPAVQP